MVDLSVIPARPGFMARTDCDENNTSPFEFKLSCLEVAVPLDKANESGCGVGCDLV